MPTFGSHAPSHRARIGMNLASKTAAIPLNKKLLFFYPVATDMLINLSSVLSFRARQVLTKARRALMVPVFVTAAFTAAGCLSARAEDPDISSRRAAERTDFTNDEIREGFFKIAFGAELQLDKPAGRVRKFDEPVRIFVETPSAERRYELAK